MKIDKRLSTAYYSRSNGGAERAVQTTKKLLSKLIMGNSEDDWDIKIDSVQLMINCKVSKRLLTSPFNLMFARRMSNDYPLFKEDTTDNNVEPMDNDELLKRIEYMHDVVYPAIKERTDAYNRMIKNQFDKSHKLVDFPVGSFVVVKTKGIRKSLSPVYEGPYEIMRKTDHGNYTLRDELGILMPRDFTPSELKIVSRDEVISSEEVYEFDGIVGHRGNPGKREYKIRWKNYSPEHNSWITIDKFTDPQSVVQYWRRLKGEMDKKDKNQLSKIKKAPSDDNTPKFNKNKKGSLLAQAEQIAETLTKQLPSAVDNMKKHGKQSSFIRTSKHTRAVANNPGHQAMRRSSRRSLDTFVPAVDTTKYKT